jgi:hypothetical protein
VTVQLISYMTLEYTKPPIVSVRETNVTWPLAWAGSCLFVAQRLLFGRAQYTAGSKKVRFAALSNEIFKMSGVNMVRPNHGSEAIESLSPPVLKGNRIKISAKWVPARSNHIIDSPLGGHC